MNEPSESAIDASTSEWLWSVLGTVGFLLAAIIVLWLIEYFWQVRNLDPVPADAADAADAADVPPADPSAPPSPH